MKLSLLVLLLLGGFHAVATEFSSTGAPQNLPEVKTVLERILARASLVAGEPQMYVYTNGSKSEELDGEGRVMSSKMKVYEVTQIGGVTHARLVKVVASDGSTLEVRSQAQREEDEKQRLGKSRSGGKRGRFEQVLTEELFKRFLWTVERRELHGERSRLLLRFQPQAQELEADKLADRVINRMTGVVWVDESEWEIVQVEASLQRRVTLWAGLIGALDRFTFNLSRARSAIGPWFVQGLDLEIKGRKLFNTLHFRVRELANDFQRASKGDLEEAGGATLSAPPTEPAGRKQP